jgi:uncharacterized protein involved in exopolysaccharide biosynthesis
MSSGDHRSVLLRRKWVILGVSLLGFIAAGVTYAVWPVPYVSVAEMYIGGVTDAPTPDTAVRETPPLNDQGEAVLNSELRIVRSFDLARQVAEVIGPAKILGDNNAATNAADLDRAAWLIHQNLRAEAPKDTRIISLSFSHRVPDVVKPVLELLITNYIIKHWEIHQRGEIFDNYLHMQTDVRKMRMKIAADQLAKVKSDAGVVDLGEEMKAFSAQEGLIRQETYQAMAELDEALAQADQLRKLLPQDRAPAAPTNAAPEAPGPMAAAAGTASRTSSPLPTFDLAGAYNTELAKIAGYQAKIKRLTNELAMIKDRGTNLVQLQVAVHEVERDMAMDEAELNQIETITDKATMDLELGPNRVSHISISQDPTPPARDLQALTTLTIIIAASGVVLGLVLAFLLGNGGRERRPAAAL